MNILQNLAGMADMTEQVIAADFLLLAKSTIRNYAVALSETTTPEVRKVLRRHLDDAINTHETIVKYMMNKGHYHVHDPQEQLMVDMQAANTALELK